MNPCTRRTAFVMTMALAAALGGCGRSPVASVDMATASGALGNVSDLDVTEHVKVALQQDDQLKGFDIQVVTLKGDVKLTGALHNQAQVSKAIQLARAADGVHAIHDELTIRQ